MATHRRSMMGFGLLPSAGGDVYPVNFDDPAASGFFKPEVIVFKDTATRIGLYGKFNVPKNYVGTAKFIIVWTANATANDCVWDIEYRAVGGNDTESLDQGTTQEAGLTVTDAAPTAVFRRLEAVITPTASNFAVDDTVEFILFRDGADANDDMTADALLFDLLFEYADA